MNEEAVAFLNPRGRRLAGLMLWPGKEQPRGLVVLCHGMLSGKNSPKQITLSERLSLQGIASLRFDFTSRYDSEGPVEEMTYTDQVEDLASAVAFARKTCGSLPLGLYGSSMGGAVVLLYAASSGPLEALATISTVGRPGELWSAWADPERLAHWRRQGWISLEGSRLPYGFYEDTLKQDVRGATSKIRSPLLLVHGAKDSIVPVAQCRELYEAARGPRRMTVLPEADHRFSRPQDLERMLQEVAGWFLTYLVERGGLSA